MKYAEFKEHEIRRTCTEQFDTPQKYRPYLQKDFQGRCCYCNMPEDLVTVPYHVEHFIPEKAFKGIRNELKTDYNRIFYRNELGGIDSDDQKGREMIKLLKLYRPVHNLAWLLERMERLCAQLEEQQKTEKNLEKRQLLESAAGKVARECVKKEKLFRAVYRGKRVFKDSPGALVRR